MGHAFQSRFHSIPVQTDAYLAEVSAYIDLNAPRGGLATRPELYPWSGCEAILTGKKDPIVDATELWGLFADDPDRARVLYRQFLYERLNRAEPLTHEKLLRKRSWGALPAVTDGRRLARV